MLTNHSLTIELALLLCVAVPTCAQTEPTVTQNATQSSCSNIVAFAGAKVDCTNMTSAQKKSLEPPIEKTVKFAVMIPFDTAPGVEPIPNDENPDDPLINTYWQLQSLASNGTIPESVRDSRNTSSLSWQMTPVSTQEAPAFFGRLLQFYIFQSIDSLQKDSITSYVGYPTEATAGIVPPDAEPYSYEEILKELNDNPFFRPFHYRDPENEFFWKHIPVKMPKGTRIRFLEYKTGERLVRLERPNYFTADFIVYNFSGTGIGNVPKHFVTQRIRTTMEWTFLVTMQYKIENRSDGGFNPNRYAQWLDALYEGIRKKLELDEPKRSR